MRRLALLLFAPLAWAASYPAPVEGDFTLHGFQFQSGETLPELKLHYATVGALHGDNAVLIMHGTGGSRNQFLSDQFAGVLFGSGELLDATRYFIILPDGIGHGKSSRPSDGLGNKFPHYNYEDMVTADYRLLTEKLGVRHLRLVMGTSMGGMQTWIWGEQYPDFMDALMPLASAPVEIGGRNRIIRKMMLDALKEDPVHGLDRAIDLLILMTSSPLQMYKQAPTREEADVLLEQTRRTRGENANATDMLYQFDSSRDYDPEPNLEKIQAPLTAINSADDFVNPPELGILERTIQRVPKGKFVLLPITDQTRGHGTHTRPAIWQSHLAELLARSESNRSATEAHNRP